MAKLDLVVGLGNPGSLFLRTRHNVGFWIVQELVQAVAWEKQDKFQGFLARKDSVRILKPNTYMNSSGSSVRKVMNYYRYPLANLLVIHDEIDLPMGVTKLKLGGSSSHNGIKDIVVQLGSEDFWRLRVGVGRPQYGRVCDHVLGRFTPKEELILEQVLEKVRDFWGDFMGKDLGIVSNQFNR